MNKTAHARLRTYIEERLQALSSGRPKRDSLSLERSHDFQYWEIAALVEVLERKASAPNSRICIDVIAELRRTRPRAHIPVTMFPSPSLLSQTEEKVMMNAGCPEHAWHGSRQSLELSDQIGRIIEIGAR